MKGGAPILVSLRGQKSSRTEALAEHARRVLEKACRSLGLGSHHEISLVVCDNATIRRLNRRWRGIDRPTDVLSFPLFDLKPGAEPPAEALGDIVVSLPTVRRAAAELGVAVEDHMAWLLIHGLLHLLGHDHQKPTQARRMRKTELALLGELGIDA